VEAVGEAGLDNGTNLGERRNFIFYFLKKERKGKTAPKKQVTSHILFSVFLFFFQFCDVAKLVII
jgi:hypothetical protein